MSKLHFLRRLEAEQSTGRRFLPVHILENSDTFVASRGSDSWANSKGSLAAIHSSMLTPVEGEASGEGNRVAHQLRRDGASEVVRGRDAHHVQRLQVKTSTHSLSGKKSFLFHALITDPKVPYFTTKCHSFERCRFFLVPS
ncbi:hypothetical protein BT93_L3162 [Corymbia citriodora subsp. variegata]|uniref:Uncharacterized protein n=1 Tax=Corymbia citriodora subsp. variegata TaxID=360336 RepID=A0A8T0CHT6_CORYI|nr:hypothetical protein BT93_L3162 [Corymbia citriodora subsp. variegata]